MVEKVEIKTPETGSEAPVEDNNALSKPEGLPEKFNSVEDLAKSYSELEAKPLQHFAVYPLDILQ